MSIIITERPSANGVLGIQCAQKQIYAYDELQWLICPLNYNIIVPIGPNPPVGFKCVHFLTLNLWKGQSQNENLELSSTLSPVQECSIAS